MALLDTPSLIAPGTGFVCGRIEPVGYEPADGSFAWVVGSDVEGQVGEFAAGDAAGVEQLVDLSDVTLISFACKLRQSVIRRAAQLVSSPGTYPTNFAGGETLDLYVDGGALQSVVFAPTDQSLSQVVDRINSVLTGAVATGDQANLRITSSAPGSSSAILLGSGTANAKLGLTGGASVSGEALAFRLRLLVSDVELYSLQPAEGETVTFAKRTANVSHLEGDRVVRLVGEAVAV